MITRTAQEHVRLSQTLRGLRTRSGLGGTEAGRRAGMSQSKLSKIETCQLLPTVDDVRKLCEVYAAPEPERVALVAAATEVREDSQRARVVLPRAAGKLRQRLGRWESAATLLRDFQPGMVVDVLQTAAYAQALTTGGLDPADVSSSEAAGSSSLSPAKSFVLIMTEGALRWQVSSPTVMFEQLDWIIETSRRPNVRVGVIPWTRAAEVFCSHAFRLYDTSAVVVETKPTPVPFTEQVDVSAYEELFAELETLASFGNEGRRELARISNEYRLLP